MIISSIKKISTIFLLLICTQIGAYTLRDEVQDYAMYQLLSGANAHNQHQMNEVQYVINLQTPGYIRKSLVNVREKDKTVSNSFFYQWKPGPPNDTGREYDFYLDGKGRCWFVLQLPNMIAFTRDGRFRRDFQGKLVTLSGNWPVLGEEGPIYIPDGGRFTVSRSGVIYANDARIGRFKIAVFKSRRDLNKLSSPNGTIFFAEETVDIIDDETVYSVVQGHLETASILRTYDHKWSRGGWDATVKTAHLINKTIGTGGTLSAP